MPEDFEDFTRQCNFSHWGGRAASLEDAAAHARQRAGTAYQNCDDKEARAWREVAIWLAQRACDERKEQEKYRNIPHGGV